jgi:hypothetical protein
MQIVPVLFATLFAQKTETVMRTITFDTLRFAERLRMAGVPEAQAKAEA